MELSQTLELVSNIRELKEEGREKREREEREEREREERAEREREERAERERKKEEGDEILFNLRPVVELTERDVSSEIASCSFSVSELSSSSSSSSSSSFLFFLRPFFFSSLG